MVLLVTYVVTLVMGQLIAVGVGLTVERFYTPRIGMLAFIPTYFVMFWVAWRVAIRMTTPRT